MSILQMINFLDASRGKELNAIKDSDLWKSHTVKLEFGNENNYNEFEILRFF